MPNPELPVERPIGVNVLPVIPTDEQGALLDTESLGEDGVKGTPVRVPEGNDETLGTTKDGESTPGGPGTEISILRSISRGVGGKPAQAVWSTVADTTTATLFLPLNLSRRGAIISNTSSARLYLLFGNNGTVSSTRHSVSLAANDVYEVPFNVVEEITGVWASDPGDGAAMITEFLL